MNEGVKVIKSILDVENNGNFALLDEKFPLFKVIRLGHMITVYDALNHFGCNLTPQQYDILLSYLNGRELSTISSHANDYAKLTNLFSHGVFSKGSFSETYTLDIEQIKKAINYYQKNIVMRRFCLEVTEECNLRCKYCPYSAPSAFRKHTGKRMSFDVAKRAIDNYYTRYVWQFQRVDKEGQRQLLELAPPNLAWYGGEPFLAFDIVRRSHEYFTKLPWVQQGIDIKHIFYSVNTNLTILDSDIIKFIVENNVQLHVSLDGPKEQHDKYRVTENGNGSFDRVMKNLQQIRQYNEKYYLERVILHSVDCPEHNDEHCIEFLRRFGLIYSRSEMQIAGHVIADPNSASRWLDTVRNTRLDQLERTLDKLSGGIDRSLYQEAVASIRRQLSSAFRGLRHLCTEIPQESSVYPFGMRACPIGFDQLFVSVNGNYHMCHKTDGSRPIGNCYIGYDFEQIVQLYHDFHKVLNEYSCRNCWAIRFCNICPAPLVWHGTIRHPTLDECNYIKKTVESAIMMAQVLSSSPDIYYDVIMAEEPTLYNGVVDLEKL